MSQINFVYKRTYTGTVRAVIFDWSGTLADPYVIAPTIVFQKVLEKHGVHLTMEQCREPMGTRKDLHLAELLQSPEAKRQWYEIHHRQPTEEDVARIYQDYVPMQLECLRIHSKVCKGVRDALNHCKGFGIKTGATTGFFRAAADVLVEELQKQGLALNANVAGDDPNVSGTDMNGNVWGQRPYPCMLWENLKQLGVYQPEAVIKVDDTVGGIGEGLAARCWTVGVAEFSNYMNINSMEEKNNMDAEEFENRLDASRLKLRQAGAHYVIDNMSKLPEVIRHINERLARGESP